MSPEDISKKLKTYAHIEYSNDEYSSVSVIKKIIQKLTYLIEEKSMNC